VGQDGVVELTPGKKLASTVCATEVIVVRPPSQPVDVECGGTPMVMADEAPAEADRGGVDAAHGDGTLLGKRYVHEDSGLELLCSTPGDGSLSVAGVPLSLKEAKPLPSSD
jgi:hypothetical protein